MRVIGVLTSRWVTTSVAVMCAAAASGAIVWAAAERTQPGVCMLEQGGRCVYELTPRRDGQVTVFMDVDGMPYRNDTMPAACLRPGPVDGLGCPEWVVNWDPTRAVGGGVVAPPGPKSS